MDSNSTHEDPTNGYTNLQPLELDDDINSTNEMVSLPSLPMLSYDNVYGIEDARAIGLFDPSISGPIERYDSNDDVLSDGLIPLAPLINARVPQVDFNPCQNQYEDLSTWCSSPPTSSPTDLDVLMGSYPISDMFRDAPITGSFDSSIRGQYNNNNNTFIDGPTSPGSPIIINEPRVAFSPRRSQYEQERQANQPPMTTTDSYAATQGFGRLLGGFNSHEGRTGAGSRSNRDNGNALRSCTCEKSQCWKLYCDCFTNNNYCGKSCSCDGCWNSIDKEDSARAALEHIKSRDSGKRKKIASSSGMQTKGCNCMKSHCQKKYCECYYAGNGCSLNCRCAGCQNSYGKRQGAEPVIQSVSRRGRKPKNSIDGRILIENSKTIDHQPIQSSMENGQIVLNHDNQLPTIVPETRECQTSQETLILSRAMPEANPEANENVSLSEAQNAAGSGSAQSELIQGPSDHSDEYIYACIEAQYT